MKITLTHSRKIETLLPLLHDADEGDDRIRAVLTDPQNTPYLATRDGEPIGAAVMRWQPDESELIYIAVDGSHRGQGFGKAIIAELLAEAGRRGVESVLVGTANSSLENIAFYQKCGFRIDSVRKDYFDYFTEPVYDNGILIRDMLMLRWTRPTD
jgi:ribosomal protein S18 acetylase RimI-like enzyme